MVTRRALGLVLLVALTIAAGLVLSRSHIALGLDFQGGSQLVYDYEPTGDAGLDGMRENMRAVLEARGIAHPDVTRLGRQIVVRFDDPERTAEVVDAIGRQPTLEFTIRPIYSASAIRNAIAISGMLWLLFVIVALRRYGVSGVVLAVGAPLTVLWAGALFATLHGTLTIASVAAWAVGMLAMLASDGILFEAQRRGTRSAIAWIVVAALQGALWVVTIAVLLVGHGMIRGFGIGALAALPSAGIVSVLGWLSVAGLGARTAANAR